MGLFIETFPALCEEQTHHDDSGRRADEQAQAGLNSQRNGNELTGLKAMVCASRLKNSKDEVLGGRADKP